MSEDLGIGPHVKCAATRQHPLYRDDALLSVWETFYPEFVECELPAADGHEVHEWNHGSVRWKDGDE